MFLPVSFFDHWTHGRLFEERILQQKGNAERFKVKEQHYERKRHDGDDKRGQ